MVNQAFLKGIIAMRFESNEKLTAYVSENPELKMLELIDCPGLTSLPELPSTLHFLLIRHCPGLTSMPALPSTLINLRIDKCPGLTSLPALPSSLAALTPRIIHGSDTKVIFLKSTKALSVGSQSVFTTTQTKPITELLYVTV
jgi:hypothetical protein